MKLFEQGDKLLHLVDRDSTVYRFGYKCLEEGKCVIFTEHQWLTWCAEKGVVPQSKIKIVNLSDLQHLVKFYESYGK